MLSLVLLNQMKHFIPSLLAFWSTNLHLVLLFILYTLLFQLDTAATASGNETDLLALLKFKESISNDPFEILNSWNTSSNFCGWHGITCSRKHQRVTMLDLGAYHLSGTISPYIGNLSFLRFLYLHNNSFHGRLPQELGCLFRLEELYVTNNTIGGEIPTNLTRCSELRHVSLEGNNLVGQIPTGIGSLTKLEWFYATTNNLTGKIPTSIGNLSSLTYLSLAYNNLEGFLPEEIGLLKNLLSLAVGANQLSGVLPSSLYNMSSLIAISAAANQFQGSLPANMFLNIPNLLIFAIGGNQISGPIPDSITNASLLQVIDISVNHFVGQVPSLGKLKDLQFLSLGSNKLGKGLEFIEPLTNCSKLSIMDITSNDFGGPLPNSVGNLSTQLSQLYFGSNQISGKIPVVLGNLNNLIILGMEDNQFMDTIPATFDKLRKVQVLSLPRNKLTGEIPTFIANLSQLFELDLSQNMFEGKIPPSIGNLQNLQKLDLSQNNLGGVIPSEVVGLSSLSVLLNLSQNSLTGGLPTEVGRLKNIGKLDLSQNQLSGEIPGTIGDCISLEHLSLQGNSLSGSIPSSLASLKGLQRVDLSQNNLSGSIPIAFEDILGLEYFNVSFNMLDGEVPAKGVFQNASALSVAANSKLCGGISELKLPKCPIRAIKHKNHQHFRFIIALISAVIFLLLIASIFAMIYHRKRRNQKSSSDSPTIDLLSKVSYQNLHNATDGFSASNLIGSGSFGSVYKGILESQDRFVAIKVLNLQKKGAQKSFIAECNVLRNVRHRNLVKILTCCSSTDYRGQEFKALVFEYMANGSLEKWLHPSAEGTGQSRTLGLNLRLNIITDVASALHYLHYECEEPIVHCDLKPSNILLDDDMVAHVGDFGLARLLSIIHQVSSKQTSSIGIKGTIGYAPPEYGMGLEVSTQGDMYSFGIFVLEILTGKRPTENMFKDGQNLHSCVEVTFPDDIFHIVDPAILSRESEQATATEDKKQKNLTHLDHNVEKCLVSLFRIGLSCSVESPKERMNIVDVTRELNVIRNAFFACGRS